ncbi:extracellular mutant protein 11-domain-containing protein [Aspergillus cavernicola]|uniref:Extracellular mutant protein 11-domain-containing protein n=1 Tax=Aspergillus cavernicola TaxID=176166 RepID=A0ABR4J2Z9_9EURO
MAFVPSASAFSLPLPLWQQDPSLRVAKYESRKRKKQYDTGEDDSDNHDDGETTDAVSEIAPINPSVILSPEQSRQYRVAGLSFDKELPGGHFPHGPIKEKNRRVNNRASILKQLSSLSQPIYAPQSAAHQENIRLRHLSVLTSVLHRCLLDGDYIRAGRAWGLIIREHFSGNLIDVRTEDRWGIGAEILLRQGGQKSGELPEGGRADNDARGERDDSSKLLFTRKGFEDAKQYYETLIIQHPYQKTAPNVISALQFYPAMFGLWVYVTQEESTAARRALEERDPGSLMEAWDDEDTESDIDWWHKYQRLAAGIRANELVEAQKIAARMDEVTSSPPYSDSPELLELRGMVSLWIADLFLSSLPGGKSDDDGDEYEDGRNDIDDDNDVSMSTDALPDSVQARRERRLAMEKRQTEIAKSGGFMDKAQQRKQGVTSRLWGLHIDETRQPQPSNQSRQALAEQARVEVPTTTLVAPVPVSFNRQAPVDRYGSPFHEHSQGPVEKPVHRDAFDTDVEGIDESTIAATSMIGIDEIPYLLSPSAQVNATAQHLNIQQHAPQQSPSPPRPFSNAHRAHNSKWYKGLGDRALKSAGFDLDDADDASQLTSTVGDDEQSNDTDDQRLVPRYREAEEPLSRRLQNFWTASRASYPAADTTAHAEPSKTPSYIPVASASKALPASSRKVTLPRSMTATPRTRFSPPKPSLLEQLDLTPTRRSPVLTRTQSQRERERGRERERETNRISSEIHDTDEGLGLFSDNHTRPGSMQSLNVFDMTTFDDLEKDESMNDPFSRRQSIKRVGTDDNTSRTRKRLLEPDYPPEILSTKSFTDLQAEPFDKTPTLTASKPVKERETNLPPEKGKEEDKISFLLRLSEQERGEYFSKLSMNEWEEYGDLLIDQFSKIMVKMKDLRHGRRKMANVFEAEIKRRHELVEEQSAELLSKFDEMRAGGAEVLRGRSP